MRKKHRRRKTARRAFAAVTLVLLICVAAIVIALARSQMSKAAVPASTAELSFLPTAANPNPSLGSPPEEMVWIPGGEFSMGAQDPRGMPEGGMQSMADARPIHRVYVDGFWMDKTDVTNEQFTRQGHIPALSRPRSTESISVDTWKEKHDFNSFQARFWTAC